MKYKSILPYVWSVGGMIFVAMPIKNSKAGSITGDLFRDSVSYTLGTDTLHYTKYNENVIKCDNGKILRMPEKAFTEKQVFVKDEMVFSITSYEKKVKYTRSDGSGFVRSFGTRTWRNLNPGAIRFGDFAKTHGAVGSAGGFAVFPNEEVGMNALKKLLVSDKYFNLTIDSVIYKYAPPSDHNNTLSYQKDLSNMTGLCLNQKICQLTPDEINKVANAIRTIEGWKPGTEEFFCAKDSLQKRQNTIAHINKNLCQKQI